MTPELIAIIAATVALAGLILNGNRSLNQRMDRLETRMDRLEAHGPAQPDGGPPQRRGTRTGPLGRLA